MNKSYFVDYPDAEIVFGFTCSVGTDLQPIINSLKTQLKRFKYKSNIYRLSDALRLMRHPEEPGHLKHAREYVRIKTLMDNGNRLREQMKCGEAVALSIIQKISRKRRKYTDYMPAPLPRNAHILYSLKNPEEVNLLRRIYGAGFFLIGVFSSQEERQKYLTDRKGLTKSEANELIIRDYNEKNKYGQNTRDTFYQSDLFIKKTKVSEEKAELKRFVELVFGNPFHTPRVDEYAMFFAYAAALRSADLSRQVGATILSKDKEILAVGTNDVPCFRGGLYWPCDPNDARDFKMKGDFNETQRVKIIEETVSKLKKDLKLKKLVAQEMVNVFKKTPIYDIIEFGRAVHAEMEALLSCARNGASPKDGTLYSTTFPCHLCTKHIVAAGIKRVVYIEPYSKSKALEMYQDSIHDSDKSPHTSDCPKVNFEHFVGIGPKKFFDLFSLTGLTLGYGVKRKNEKGKVNKWDYHSADLKVRMLPLSYLNRELSAVLALDDRTK